jgi:hypothetical protein
MIASGDTVELAGITTQLFVVRLRARLSDLEGRPAGPHKIQVRVESLTRPGVSVDDKATFFIPK